MFLSARGPAPTSWVYAQLSEIPAAQDNDLSAHRNAWAPCKHPTRALSVAVCWGREGSQAQPKAPSRPG